MTADQDFPNSVAQEAAFWANQRTLPHGAERPEAEPVKRSRVLMRTVAGALVIIGCIALARGVLGAERPAPVFQIWAAKPGEDWAPVRTKSGEVWNFTSPTACSVDVVSVIRGLPAGSIVACRRITSTKGE